MINKIKQFFIRFKKWLIAIFIGTSAIAMVGEILPEKPLPTYQVIEWIRPTTDAEWAEDVKAESLNLRFDYQLQEMLTSHQAKLEKFLEDNKISACPECIKFDLKKANPEMSIAEIDILYAEQLAGYNWEIDKLNQSVERLQKEIELRKDKKVNRKEDIKRITPSTDKEKEELIKLKNEK